MNSAVRAVFDTQEAVQINKARQEAVRELLLTLRTTFALRTALDAGCGVGHFSRFLRELGFSVIAADGREENVFEARLRYPEIDFHVADVETDSFTQMGAFDLVFCMGLLYHLENPLRAIRGLRRVTKTCLVVESMCYPEAAPWMLLREEPCLTNQSLTDVAFYPTEGCLVKMLYRAGFSNVYRLRELPDHDDFRDTDDHVRRRTVLTATFAPIPTQALIPLVEPREDYDPWNKCGNREPSLTLRSRNHLYKPMRRLTRFAARPWRSQLRSFAFRWLRAFPAVPLPFRLPFGAWWLLRNDQMGATLLEDRFEVAEYRFIERLLRPGMIVLDIGANQGYYTLLSARKVGPNGKVLAFEPSPREMSRLKLHLWLNGCKNVEVSSFALGAVAGTGELHVVLGTETGCNSLRSPGVSEPTRPLPVRVECLDDVLKAHGINHVDFVKLDVEGAELSVLQGAPELLRRSPRPVILAEVQDVRTHAWGYRAAEILSCLSALGYHWFGANSAGQLARLSTSQETCDGNFFAIPQERIASLGHFISSDS